MKVTIIIPTYNRPGLAASLTKQIRNLGFKDEIIIIDQSNKKENLDGLEKLRVKYLTDVQVNTARAKNIGIKEAKGEIIIFFDDDVELTKDTINAHISAYKNKEVLGVAGRVINDGEEVPSNADVETGKANESLTAFVGNFWGTKTQFVQFPFGCNMSFRKSILEGLKGFDEKITPPGFEEYDLGLRVSRIGKIIFVPEALVFHHRAKSGGNRLSRDDWYKKYYWNYGRMIRKHVKFPFLIISLIHLKLRIIREYPNALVSFFSGFISA